MMSQSSPEWATWQARWVSLDETMKEMLKQDWTMARGATLLSLTRHLQGYAGRLFDFLYDGFGDSQHIRLERSRHFPVEYAFRHLLDQVSFDLAVIRTAASQRLGSARQQRALATSDALAWMALKPALGSLVTEATVVTYFQKQPAVRVIPYAPVALVGVPYTAMPTEKSAGNMRDFLAIPHEVGHYVYRHGWIEGERCQVALRNSLPGEPVWLERWLEELFADVYGGLIGGPIMALSFQELQTDNHIEELGRDDGRHPVAALRPYVYSDLLRGMGLAIPADQLDKKWAGSLRRLGAPESFRPFQPEAADGGATERVPLTKARDEIKEVVKLIEEKIVGLIPSLGGAASSNWSGADSTGNVADMFKGFINRLQSLSPGTMPQLPELMGDANGSQLQPAQNVGAAKKYEIGATDLWGDDLLRPERPGPRRALPPAVWLEVVFGNGWVAGGPEGDPHPK
ncbi:MAG: hypothetical protein AB1791_13300 [Chloroflexota bacterium]